MVAAPCLPLALGSFPPVPRFAAGRSSLAPSPPPPSAATLSATRFASPVSMTIFATPAFFSCAMASLECGFTTSDSYIERVTYELRGRRKVRVATSDNLEQLIILGHGAVRVSAKSFHDEVFGTNDEIRRILQENNRKNR